PELQAVWYLPLTGDSATRGQMQTGKFIVLLLLFVATGAARAIQQEPAPAELKEAALRDAACAGARDTQTADAATVSAVAGRGSGEKVGTNIAGAGGGHWHSDKFGTLGYLCPRH